MIRSARALVAAAVLSLSSVGLAAAADITVEDAKARVIAPTTPAAAYLTIKNAGVADRLVGVSSPAFARAELHTVKKEGEVAKMLKLEAIEIPAKGQATLQSGGNHVMLFKAAKPLKVGDSFPLKLTFEKAGEIEIKVSVAPLKDTLGKAAHGGHGMDHSKMDHSKMKDAGHEAHGGAHHGHH